jgi:hypothetical protein
LGWKSIETRTHGRFAGLQGKRIGIHAGKTWDRLAYIKAGDFLTLEQIHASEELRLVHSAILCTALVQECRTLNKRDSRAAMCNAEGLHGLVLQDVRLPIYNHPISVAGEQGIWYYPKAS